MSDWYGNARSNYFKVKDQKKFIEFCKGWGVEAINKEFEVVSDHCTECLNNIPDTKCTEYVKRVVDKCEGKKEKQMLCGFLGETDKGGLPSFKFDDETGIEYDFDDFKKELIAHISDGWVVVMQEVGAEKLRYITGSALAINSRGEEEYIDINEIYDKSKNLGKHIEICEY